MEGTGVREGEHGRRSQPTGGRENTIGPGGDERTGRGLAERISAWVPWSRQTLLFGVAVSLFIHLAMLLWAGVVVWGQAPAAASTGEGDVPLAVVAENDLEDGLLSGLAPDVPTLDELDEPQITAPDEGASESAEQQTLEMSDVGDVGGAGDVESMGGGGVFAPGGGAQFFGVEARGSRFAYVLDVSGSMNGERIAALRIALANSLAGLFEHAHFVIVPYNDQAVPIEGWDWFDATERAKRRMIGRFNSLEPQAGTDPRTAFRVVFGLRPRPDAIYFMTDGVFQGVEEALLALLDRENAGGGAIVPIHCITLIEPGAEQIMRTIAQRSGGTYTHIGASP